MKVDPSPGVPRAVTAPPCRSAILRQMARPMPAPSYSPRPGLILLDLNMPRKDGREALAEIKADPELRTIRVVVLTTSKAEEDILRTYNLSAASYISKPVTFEALVDVIKTLGKYWLEIVELPVNGNGG